jgi:hypothetical protein
MVVGLILFVIAAILIGALLIRLAVHALPAFCAFLAVQAVHASGAGLVAAIAAGALAAIATLALATDPDRSRTCLRATRWRGGLFRDARHRSCCNASLHLPANATYYRRHRHRGGVLDPAGWMAIMQIARNP